MVFHRGAESLGEAERELVERRGEGGREGRRGEGRRGEGREERGRGGEER